MTANSRASGDLSGFTPESPPPLAESIRPRTWWLIVVVLIGVWLVLRLLILDEFLRVNPIAERPWLDAWVYWQAAGRMAEGRWTDGYPFLSAPLYPYLLGVIRSAGGSLVCVYTIQLIVHLLTAVLIAWATRLRFGMAAGLVATGLFLALTEPAVSSTRLLANTLQLLLVVIIWWRWAILEQKHRRWRDVVSVGALIGLFALSYPAAILLIPIYPLWLLLAERWTRAGLGKATAGCCSAILLVLPATIHNLAVSGELIPICANGGINLRIGNGPDSFGIGGTIPGVRPRREVMFDDAARVFERVHGRPGTWREIDVYFRTRALEYCRANPLRALSAVGMKLYMFVAARNYDEMMPTVVERVVGFGRRATLAPLATPWLMGMALIGLLVVLRHPVRYGPEWLLVLLPLIVVLLFFYTPRYRLPAVPLLCGLSGYALCHLRRLRMATPLVVLVFLLPVPLWFINSYFGIDSPKLQQEHFAQAFSKAQSSVADSRVQAQEFAEAERLYKVAIRLWPENPLPHRGLGCLYARQNRLEEAVSELREAIRLRSRNTPLHFHLYNALQLQGRYAEAVTTLDRATQLSPRALQAHLALAWLLATCPDEDIRDGQRAVRAAEQAQQLSSAPESDVLDVLAAAYAELNRFPEAVDVATRAAALARREGRVEEAVGIEQRLANYRNQKPCRAAPRTLRPR